MTTLLNLLNITSWDDLLLAISQKSLYCLLVYLGFNLTKRLIKWLYRRNSNKIPLLTSQDLARQQTLVKLFFSLIDYIAFFLMGYWFLLIWGVPITSLLAGAGLAGLAIGLGAQGFLNDVINGFFILLERQFDVGDTVTIQTVTGTVTNLGIRTTQIQSRDGSLHFIPNRSITLVSNLSRLPALITIDLPLTLTTDTRMLHQLLAEVTANSWQDFPALLDEPTLVGPVLSPLETPVFRVELRVHPEHKRDTYQAFYRLYHQALQTSTLHYQKETPHD